MEQPDSVGRPCAGLRDSLTLMRFMFSGHARSFLCHSTSKARVKQAILQQNCQASSAAPES